MAMSPRLLRPRATGFSPKSISGLALWLDATDSATISTDTGVSEWRDKSGNGRNFSQSVGNNQPTLTTMNGKTALNFNGTSHRLTRASAMFTTLSGTQDAALFFVVDGTFPGTAGHVFNHTVAAGGADNNMVNIEWRADQGASWIFGTLRTRVQAIRTGTTYTADQRFDSVNVSGVGVISIVGSFGATTTTNTSYWNNSASPSSASTSDAGTVVGMAIGCRNNATPSLFYTGKVAEIVAYSSALSTSQRTTIQNYLARKWGATLA